MPDPLIAVALFFVAMAGGALNALSGGGTFLVFPALLLVNVPAVVANATCTVALGPGVASSALAYRKELEGAPARLPLAIISVVGGTFGALLLLRTPSKVFEGLVPFLLLFATIVFAFGPSVTRRIGYAGDFAPGRHAVGQLTAILIIQFAISVYGGYFGAGIGILMLAALSFFGFREFHRANALRTFLAACINGVAMIAFIAAGAVAWSEAVVMLFGAVIGGYVGVRVLRRVSGLVLRRVVIGVALAMTVYFFIRAYA